MEPRTCPTCGSLLDDQLATCASCGAAVAPDVPARAATSRRRPVVGLFLLASAVLAIALGAERLVLLTDVDAAYDGWGTSGHRPIGRTTVASMRARHFAPGSMGPKVEAACRFVERTGRAAHIGALDHAEAVVAGRAGTVVEP